MPSMRRRALLLALLALALSAAQCSAYEPLRKVVIESPKQAVCLDGTSPAVFVRPADPANWVIFFQGGDQCTVRSQSLVYGRAFWPRRGAERTASHPTKRLDVVCTHFASCVSTPKNPLSPPILSSF